MILPGMELTAQVAVERVLNSLPEGLLVAVCAWALLLVMGRQNAGTRFAVWMVALVSVAVLPWLRGLHAAAFSPGPSEGTALVISAFWAFALFLIWMLAAGALLARLVAGVWQMKRMRSNCREVPLADLPPALQEPIRESSRRARILISDEARVPAATGLWKPAIILPAWALGELSAEDLLAVVVHELTHLQRRDDWTNLLQKSVRAVLVFHPAIWWIESRLSVEREMACDDVVLAATGNPRAYAGCLIRLLERSCARRGWTAAQAAVAHARDAARRIAQILHPRRAAGVRVGRLAPAAAAALSAACLGIAVCAPQFVAVSPEELITIASVTPPAVPALPAHHAQVRVVPAAFVVRRAVIARHRHAIEPVGATRSLPAVLALRKAPAPRVERASLDPVPALSAPKQAAPQWAVYETAVYSRAISTESMGGAPAMVQTFTVQTVNYVLNGVAVQRTFVVQVVWMVPVQAAAEAQTSSKSI
ncbi:MAG TPA: M56 family metallopeptidase [Acidobacteriaceae bacterium]|nr:M56 family metallopeptidase [Acidobacteriaceae bacterium]